MRASQYGYHCGAGLGADLLASGRWLTRRAAADALGCSLADFDRLCRDGEIRSRAVGPGVRLYQVRA